MNKSISGSNVVNGIAKRGVGVMKEVTVVLTDDQQKQLIMRYVKTQKM